MQSLARGVGRHVVALAGLLWAGAVAMLGWSLVIDPPTVWREVFRGLGFAGVAGGQFVFLTVCSDRWIPDASPGLRRWVAIGLFACVVFGLALALVAASKPPTPPDVRATGTP